jgi:putative polyhydroxyalkanoate system protein
MSTIDVCAHHQMDHEAAQQAADDLASDLARKFDIDYGWDEDVIYFERPGVSGSITVGASEIRITAQLGILLMMLKGRIENEIRHYLQSHFGCTFDR